MSHFFQNQVYIHDLSSGNQLFQLPLEVGTIVGYSGKKKDTEVRFSLKHISSVGSQFDKTSQL